VTCKPAKPDASVVRRNAGLSSAQILLVTKRKGIEMRRIRFDSSVSLLAVLVTTASVCRPIKAGSLVWRHDAKFDYDVATANEVPHWAGGALLAVEGEFTATLVVKSFDQEGTNIASAYLTIPEAVAIGVHDYTRSLDGTIVLSGTAFDQVGRTAPFLAWIPPFAENVRVVRTSPYVPYCLALAPDGTVWTVGLELIDGSEPAANQQYGVLRHFDKSGRLIASFIPRSTIQSPHSIIYGYLAARKDRIGWYAGRLSQTAGSAEYIELLGNNMVRRFPGVPWGKDEEVTGIAVTEDAGTFVTTHNHQTRRATLRVIDQARGVWVPIEIPAKLRSYHWVHLYGSEGNDLVLMAGDRFTVRFYTVAP
jgi:hypothetical protein